MTGMLCFQATALNNPLLSSTCGKRWNVDIATVFVFVIVFVAVFVFVIATVSVLSVYFCLCVRHTRNVLWGDDEYSAHRLCPPCGKLTSQSSGEDRNIFWGGNRYKNLPPGAAYVITCQLFLSFDCDPDFMQSPNIIDLAGDRRWKQSLCPIVLSGREWDVFDCQKEPKSVNLKYVVFH